MNDTPRNNAQPPLNGAGAHEEFGSDQSVESAALAGAAAIQHLIAERNGLRNHLVAQERELAALRALNEDLRRRLLLLHQHYVEAAKSMVGRLEQFGGALRETVQEAHTGPAPREDAAPASLAQRLAEHAGSQQAAHANGSEPASA